MTLDDAIRVTIGYLRLSQLGLSNYGYDVYVPALARKYIQANERLQPHETERRVGELYMVFGEACWHLCTRGILRPGLNGYQAQMVDDGYGGGYVWTEYGKRWLTEPYPDSGIPDDPSRFDEAFANFQTQFGPGYRQRSQQAIKCYEAHVYIACCAMCGAAAESVLLKLCIEKTQDEDWVLRTYASAQGRSRIENRILGQLPQPIQDMFRGFTQLVKYWRDEASHGIASSITSTDAFLSLTTLLRFAHFGQDRWEQLTAH